MGLGEGKTSLRNRVVSNKGRTNLVEYERGKWEVTGHCALGVPVLELVVGYRVYSILIHLSMCRPHKRCC